MDATSGSYLVTELQDLKATVRKLSLSLPWQTLAGLQGVGWTGGLVWTFIGQTSASIQGDQSQATGTGYLKVGARVRAFVTAGVIYGFITSTSVAGGNTTANFSWDLGSLDSGLSDIQIAGDPAAASGGFNVYQVNSGNPAVDVVNTTSETTIYTTSIPGNAMGAQGMLRVTAIGDWLYNLNNATLRLRCKFGGTTVLDSGLLKCTTLHASNRIPIVTHWHIMNLGNPALQFVAGELSMGTNQLANGILGGAVTISLTNAEPPLTGEYAGLAIDTTQGQTLAMSIQLSSATTTIEYRSYGVFVELFS
jgi:hypothetical protein